MPAASSVPVISFAGAIENATAYCMQDDSTVHVMGLGATYPNGLDGTMGTLASKYKYRVHDMPCSENALTGMAVGAAVTGLRPIVHHGRIEFALHAMDQIITQAAKWNYMFGGGYACPITLRIATGRQWGNGPQHTLTNRSLFAVPGLKVVCPSTPEMANLLLKAAVQDNDPVIFLESRWLYKLKQDMPFMRAAWPLDKADIIKEGNEITVVAIGDMVLEALRAVRTIGRDVNIELIDAVSVYPIDYETIERSVQKTRNLLVIDATTPAYSTAHEIIAVINSRLKNWITSSHAITCQNIPCPTATSLTSHYYPIPQFITAAIINMLGGFIPYEDPLTFDELNLPPTSNISELLP